ncbi:flippase-like domain-containing protein [Thermovirga sp.]|uniref:lysylphosphatidylglycerol synthase transmembrane domain-containing protein n=1 Tax=Thermovirga sp. TaxID=2699834 RepID=UPI0025F54FDB|nr:flippase-like domain-containing protein [Thermovirga sp.]MBO8153345.1 flippase-like domain-containing protein [Thermovirga sp.]
MSVRKGLALFIGLSFIVSFIVLMSSMDLNTMDILSRVDIRKLGYVFLLLFLSWCLDAYKLYSVVAAAGERIPYKFAFLLNWLRYFGCAITPMQSGGGPFQVYFLYKSGIPIGKGVAITLVSTLMTLLQIGIIVPVALMYEPSIIKGKLLLKGALYYVIVFVMISWVIIALSLLRPSLMKKLSGAFILLLNRWGIVKKKKLLKFVRRAYREIDNYNRNFQLFFTTGLKKFILAFLVSWLQMIVLFSILPLLIWSFGFDVSYMGSFFAQALLMFILYFVPTPGASGVAEGGGTAIFAFLVPWNMAGVLAVTWRFFTEYLSIAMGALTAVVLLGWRGAEQVLGDYSGCDDGEEK